MDTLKLNEIKLLNIRLLLQREDVQGQGTEEEIWAWKDEVTREIA